MLAAGTSTEPCISSVYLALTPFPSWQATAARAVSTPATRAEKATIPSLSDETSNGAGPESGSWSAHRRRQVAFGIVRNIRSLLASTRASNRIVTAVEVDLALGELDPIAPSVVSPAP